jgi:hypothetical protein
MVDSPEIPHNAGQFWRILRHTTRFQMPLVLSAFPVESSGQSALDFEECPEELLAAVFAIDAQSGGRYNMSVPSGRAGVTSLV